LPCYRPLQAWRQPVGKYGELKLVFSNPNREAEALKLPCGQCIGCRLERSRRWAVRLMHEKQLHEKSCFLTLTYDDERCPVDGSLKVEDFQLFMKRLRRGSGSPLRFFHCGEYGETTLRPHYHCCLFGEDFSSDRVYYKTSSAGHPLWTSAKLTEVWENGHAIIGDLSFESAAYVARYCLKKVTGRARDAHYGGRRPEYVTMSRRPGIGASWFNKFRADVFPRDRVVMRGREMVPPPFYDKLLAKVDPELHSIVKERRVEEAERAAEKGFVEFVNSPDFGVSKRASPDGRRRVEELCKQAAVKQLKRTL